MVKYAGNEPRRGKRKSRQFINIFIPIFYKNKQKGAKSAKFSTFLFLVYFLHYSAKQATENGADYSDRQGDRNSVEEFFGFGL